MVTALPLTSVTPAIVIVSVWLSGNGAYGSRYTSLFWLAKLKEPVTAAAPVTAIVPLFTVNGFSGSEKRTTMRALSPTFVEPAGGVIARTDGAVASRSVPV